MRSGDLKKVLSNLKYSSFISHENTSTLFLGYKNHPIIIQPGFSNLKLLLLFVKLFFSKIL